MVAVCAAAAAADPAPVPVEIAAFDATVPAELDGLHRTATTASWSPVELRYAYTMPADPGRTIRVRIGDPDNIDVLKYPGVIPRSGTLDVGGAPGAWWATETDHVTTSIASVVVGGAEVEVWLTGARRPDAAAAVLPRMATPEALAAYARWRATGTGTRTGSGSGSGSGANGIGFGEPIILGALDRAHIDAVVQAAPLGACVTPASRGSKVVIKATIAKDGMVSSSVVKSTTGQDAQADLCLADTLARLQFDPPKGGGIVIFSYPFLIEP